MLKWALTLAVLGALAAAGAWFPIHGRTVLDRWRAASGPVEFARRGAAEVQAALGLGTPSAPAKVARPKAPGRAAPSARPAPPARHPTERHTDEDRAALDRLLAERAGR